MAPGPRNQMYSILTHEESTTGMLKDRTRRPFWLWDRSCESRLATCTVALRDKAAETGLHTGVWVCPGVWVPSRGYTRVFEYAQVFESPIGATHRCLESQPGLNTGVWIPTHKPGLHMGVWSPKRAIVQVASWILPPFRRSIRRHKHRVSHSCL